MNTQTTFPKPAISPLAQFWVDVMAPKFLTYEPILVGGMIQVGVESSVAVALGAIAIFVATINIAGGFLVTHRMLKMFRK